MLLKNIIDMKNLSEANMILGLRIIELLMQYL